MKEGHVAILLLLTRSLGWIPCGVFDSVERAEAFLKDRGSVGEVKQIPLNTLSLFPDAWSKTPQAE